MNTFFESITEAAPVHATRAHVIPKLADYTSTKTLPDNEFKDLGDDSSIMPALRSSRADKPRVVSHKSHPGDGSVNTGIQSSPGKLLYGMKQILSRYLSCLVGCNTVCQEFCHPALVFDL